MDMFKNIKIRSKGTWKPCQTGVLLATKSIIDLQNIFLNEKSYKFLLTGRFSQDCLKNLFSCIRSVQPIQNSLQIKSNLKLVCVAQFLKNVSNSSCDLDDREFLGNILDFSNVNLYYQNHQIKNMNYVMALMILQLLFYKILNKTICTIQQVPILLL